MLLSDRRVVLSKELFRSSRTLKSDALHVQLVETAGCQTDTTRVDDVLGIAPMKHTLTIVLDGVYASGDDECQSGGAIVESRDRWRERWLGPRQRFVSITWEGQPPASGQSRLGPKAREAWTDFADRFVDADFDDAATLATTALSLARSAGLDLPTPTTTVEAEVRRVGRALNHLFTNLHTNPQAVDLEQLTGLSARHLRRIMKRHPALLPQSLRAKLGFYRLVAALSLMRTTATVGEVARALGYGSDRALHTAIRRTGI